MYYGKATDTYKNNNECSSKIWCNWICNIQSDGPSDTEYSIVLGYFYFIMKYINIFVFIIIIFYIALLNL